MDLSLVAPAELPKVVELDIKEGVENLVEPIVKEISFNNGLAKISKKQLVNLGVSDADVEKLMHADSEDLLLSLLEHIKPIELGEALLDIATNPSSFEERKARLVREKPKRDLSDILKTNFVDRENYFVLSEDLYERFFNGTLEDWQVFLHPDQSRAVEMESNGPMMVTGPAGTGKSVVAVHRVKWLLEHKYKQRGKILFTTFTHTLAEYARKLLRSICSDEEMQRVKVMHFDQYLQELLKRHLNRVYIDYNVGNYNRSSQFLRIVINECNKRTLPRDPEFVASEFDRVISENDIRNLEQYKEVVRPKDLGRLNNEIRAQLWPVLDAIDNELQIKRTVPRAVAINRLIEEVDSHCCEYDSIIVDEAQDFGAPEYRLLAKLTGNSYANAVPYSLFFAGDGHQRIYNRSGSLKQCGINVTGRSVKLFKCYRSTKKIREYAEKIIDGVQVKDMDSEADKLLGGESLIEGVSPQIRFGKSKDEKINYIVEAIKSWVAEGGKAGDCAVLVNRNAAIDDVVIGLNRQGVNAVCVNRDEANFDEHSVKVMTMYRAKGLQFINVVVDVDQWPRRAAVRDQEDQDISKELLDKEKCLLYMSVMRAVSNVLITNSCGSNKYIPPVSADNAFNSNLVDRPTEPTRHLQNELELIKSENVLGNQDVSLSNSCVYSRFLEYLKTIKMHCNDAQQYRQAVLRLLLEDKSTKILASFSAKKYAAVLANVWADFARQNDINLSLEEAAKESLSSKG
jgi:superfamily I DNA/RNA helicase